MMTTSRLSSQSIDAAKAADKKLIFIPIVYILLRIWGTIRFFIFVTGHSEKNGWKYLSLIQVCYLIWKITWKIIWKNLVEMSVFLIKLKHLKVFYCRIWRVNLFLKSFIHLDVLTGTCVTYFIPSGGGRDSRTLYKELLECFTFFCVVVFIFRYLEIIWQVRPTVFCFVSWHRKYEITWRSLTRRLLQCCVGVVGVVIGKSIRWTKVMKKTISGPDCYNTFSWIHLLEDIFFVAIIAKNE